MGDDIRDRFRMGAASQPRRDFLGPMPPQRPANQPPRQPAAPQSFFPGAPAPPQPQAQARPQQSHPKPHAAAPSSFFGAPAPRPQATAQPKPPSRPSAKPLGRNKKKSRSKKPAVFAVVAMLLLGFGFAGWKFTRPQSAPESANSADVPQTAGVSDEQTPTEEVPQGTLKLVATGSFAAYDSVNQNAKNGSAYNYTPLMDDLKPVFESADVSLCDQETMGGGADKGVSGYPDFNAPNEWNKALAEVGCNVIDLASIHTNDKGQSAVNNVLDFYAKTDSVLATVGANKSQKEQDEIRYVEVKGIKIAILSFTTSSRKNPGNDYTVNLYSESKAKAQLKAARKEARFTIVNMNWGKEDTAGLQEEQTRIAKTLAAADADLVIGNGAHIVQPTEILDGSEGHQTLVVYGLGNAVNSQLPITNLIGAVLVLDIDLATGNILNPGILPVYQHYEWTAAQKANSDFDSRKNLNLFMLDQAADALKKSQNNTTVDAQTKRIKDIVTSKKVPIKMLTSKDLE